MPINIVDRSKQTSGRIWVIRSGDDAKYYRHLRSKKLTAIGHVDSSYITALPSGPLDEKSSKQILDKYATVLKEKDKSKSYIATQVNQVRRFLFEVSIGDTVLTVDKKNVLVGFVESDPFLSREGVVLESSLDNKGDVCEFPIRRKMVWGNAVSKDSLPYNVERSFRNTSTIFEISDPDKVKSLNHWLYPVHISENEMRCSLLIKQKEEIPNRELTNLSAYFDQLEAYARFIASKVKDGDIELSTDELERFLSGYNEYTLTTQHAFMSEGLQYVQFKGDRIEKMVFGALFSLLFASSSLAEDKDNPEIQNINTLVKAPVDIILKQEQFRNTKEALKLTVNSPNVSAEKVPESDDLVEFVKPTPSDKKIF